MSKLASLIAFIAFFEVEMEDLKERHRQLVNTPQFAAFVDSIRHNTWGPGSMLPGEVELAQRFGCARPYHGCIVAGFWTKRKLNWAQ